MRNFRKEDNALWWMKQKDPFLPLKSPEIPVQVTGQTGKIMRENMTCGSVCEVISDVLRLRPRSFLSTLKSRFHDANANAKPINNFLVRSVWEFLRGQMWNKRSSHPQHGVCPQTHTSTKLHSYWNWHKQFNGWLNLSNGACWQQLGGLFTASLHHGGLSRSELSRMNTEAKACCRICEERRVFLFFLVGGGGDLYGDMNENTWKCSQVHQEAHLMER